MLRTWIIANAALALLGVCATASAQQSTAPATVYAPPQLPPRNETPEARRARWEAWRAANADIDARIATFLRDTEARIAEYRSRPVVDRFAALRDGVTAARRREAITYFGNAFTIWQAGDFPAAEIGFRRGLEIDPTNAPANFYMGDLLRRRGDNSGAREHYERAVAFGEGSAESIRSEAALAQLPPGEDRSLDQPPTIWETASRPALIWDSAEAPEMVVIPAGVYTMGSPPSEADRDNDEGPRVRVTLARPFAVSVREITVSEYSAFSSDTRRRVSAACETQYFDSFRWRPRNRQSWRDPGFAQTPDHPVVCVSWEDAKAYVAWLSARTNQQYRLLSESEWEYVARAGATSAYPWGADANAGCSFANGVDRAVGMRLYDHRMVCDDGAADATPVGSYSANAFGLYDTIGNVFEWVEDCYAATLSSTPTDGRPADGATCARRVARGGSWDHFPRYLRSAFRKADAPTYRTNHLGFRVARALQ